MKRLFFILLFVPAFAQGQMITTFAGGGTSGLGNGGPATSAQLAGTCCLVFDKKENLYSAEGIGSPRIRMVNTSGIIYTIAGTGIPGYSGDNGPATAAQLNYPTGIAINNKSGNIYIADWYNHNIRKIDSSGIITTFAGNGIAAFSGDSGLAINASLTPQGLCLDSFGNLYVIDTTARIRKIDTTGIITTIAGNGIYGFSGDGGLADTAEISPTYGIRIFDNKLYISGEDRIRVVNMTTGIINTVAGDGYYLYNGEGIHADSAQFSAYIIDIDGEGNIYISDISNQRVRKINMSNIIYTIAGNGIAGFSGDGGVDTLAEIHDPEGTAVDTCGNLYIADNGNGRIRKVAFNACHPFTEVSSIVSANTLTIFPNPATTSLTIQSTNTPIAQITITNLLGQTMYLQSAPANCNLLQVDVSTFPTGIYFLKVNGTEVKKFVKE